MLVTLDDREALNTFTTRQLKAYKTILEMGTNCIMSEYDRKIDKLHLSIVTELLESREK